MINRIALFAASLVAALAVTVGLVIAGFAPQAPASAPVSAPVVASSEAPAPTVQVDTVYVAPKPTPQEITLTKVVKATAHGDDVGEHETESGND